MSGWRPPPQPPGMGRSQSNSYSNSSRNAGTQGSWSEQSWSVRSTPTTGSNSWGAHGRDPYQQQFPPLGGQPQQQAAHHQGPGQGNWAQVVTGQQGQAPVAVNQPGNTGMTPQFIPRSERNTQARPAQVSMGKNSAHRGTFTFDSGPTQQQPARAAAPAAPSSDKWPPTLRRYVEKAFASKAYPRATIEQALKKVITRAVANNALWNSEWDSMPDPMILAQTLGDQATAKPRKSRWDTDSSQPVKRAPSPPVASKPKARESIKKKGKNKKKNKEAFLQSAAIAKRAARFNAIENSRGQGATSSKLLSITKNVSGVNKVHEFDWDAATIVGTSTALEKQYLRLTSAPDPSTVRPLPVLKKALKHLMKKYKDTEDYHFACEQLKSIRQDLTVQRIKNEFTVKVYEVHARVALENDDSGEYNQCQSVLKRLYYDDNLPGEKAEFLAYRVLYYVLHMDKFTSELGKLYLEYSQQELSHPSVKHALDVREALASGNYCRVFKLSKICPNMGPYLMDMFRNRVRIHALRCMCKAYRPGLPLSFITSQLGFASLYECGEFLIERDAVFKSREGHASQWILNTAGSYKGFMREGLENIVKDES